MIEIPIKKIDPDQEASMWKALEEVYGRAFCNENCLKKCIGSTEQHKECSCTCQATKKRLVKDAERQNMTMRELIRTVCTHVEEVANRRKWNEKDFVLERVLRPMNWHNWNSFCKEEIDDLFRNYTATDRKEIFSPQRQAAKLLDKQEILSTHDHY